VPPPKLITLQAATSSTSAGADADPAGATLKPAGGSRSSMNKSNSFSNLKIGEGKNHHRPVRVHFRVAGFFGAVDQAGDDAGHSSDEGDGTGGLNILASSSTSGSDSDDSDDSSESNRVNRRKIPPVRSQQARLQPESSSKSQQGMLHSASSPSLAGMQAQADSSGRTSEQVISVI